jgi:hypothetical protein
LRRAGQPEARAAPAGGARHWQSAGGRARR